MKLTIGSPFPDFSFDTASARGLRVQNVLQESRYTVFWVLRYIGCPTCRLDVALLAEQYGEFTAKDAQIYVVMQSSAENLKKDLAGEDVPFSIISDPNMEIYERFEIPATETKEERLPKDPEGMAKLAAKREKVRQRGFVHGEYEGNEQQLPAVFVVDREGVVRYAHYARHSADMPTPDEMLERIGKL